MLKDIKATNENIIKEHFSEIFGKNYTIECNWNFPVCILTIVYEDEQKMSEWKIITDLTTQDFNLETFATKNEKVENSEDVKVLPDKSSIDNKTINFIIERLSLISESFFTTRKVQPAEETARPAEETAEIKE